MDIIVQNLKPVQRNKNAGLNLVPVIFISVITDIGQKLRCAILDVMGIIAEQQLHKEI